MLQGSLCGPGRHDKPFPVDQRALKQFSSEGFSRANQARGTE